MTNIKRYYVPNAFVFITSLTKDRNKIFNQKENKDLLILTIENVKNEIPFEVFAFVILPDHFHLIIQSSNDESNFSKILQLIKGRFTYQYKIVNKIKNPLSLWQRRFWDHIIRDENDLKNHLDYIHWNPVKHGYVHQPNEWVDSSFQNWINRGLYTPKEFISQEPENIRKMNFE